MRNSFLPSADESPKSVRVISSPKPVSPENWPAWAKALAETKIASDAGVGDTAYRLFHSKPLNPFSAAIVAGIELFGKKCGCETRCRNWNELYPYHGEPPTASFGSIAR